MTPERSDQDKQGVVLAREERLLEERIELACRGKYMPTLAQMRVRG